MTWKEKRQVSSEKATGSDSTTLHYRDDDFHDMFHPKNPFLNEAILEWNVLGSFLWLFRGVFLKTNSWGT